jgi:peptide deformylase
MILTVVKYGHPALRQKGVRVPAVTPAVQQLVADMLETMHVNKGVGLAAQQVGQALQLTVIDVRGVTDRPSSLAVAGQSVNPHEFMPLVLINPEVAPGGEIVAGAEGCLSFPEIFAEIRRPESVQVQALDKDGKLVALRCGGLLARVVQHEVDHLNGILFIDRMDRKTKDELRPELDALQAATKAELQEAAKK